MVARVPFADAKAITRSELATLVRYLGSRAKDERRRGMEDGPRRRDLLLVTLLASTGLRAFEAAQLRVQDVVFEGRGGHLRIAREKKEGETVPLSFELATDLRAWIRSRAPSSPLFPRPLSRAPINRKEVWEILKGAVYACSLRHSINAHSLRHYFTSTIAKQTSAARRALIGPLRIPGNRRPSSRSTRAARN